MHSFANIMDLEDLQVPTFSQTTRQNFLSGSDPSRHCRVVVGNLHPALTESGLKEFFTIAGPVKRCNVIHNDKSHGYVVFENHQSAIIAIGVLNGASLLGKSLIVSWPQPTNPQEGQTTSYYYVTVGELMPEITGDVLYAYFSVYDSCVEAKVLMDANSQPLGAALVSFRSQQHAYRAAHELNGTLLEGRQILCALDQSTAAPCSAAHSYNIHHFSGLSSPELPVTPFNVEDEEQMDPQFSLIHVSKLNPGVTEKLLWTFFNDLGAGMIESCQVVQGMNCAFVRYSSQYEAAVAILKGCCGRFFGATIKCQWFERPTPTLRRRGLVPPELTAMLASARVRAHRLLKAHLRQAGH
ncbi:oligouridylate-binding protein 1-like [Andrographis paniculata]|uniref:oligouridylate-binding protein 1-like n=1 Tax=Andrographis paniculata TaxID=175694 RepID=UPI0021E8AD44|nr:oligouridylate-binding protein 1-like [Andrographis paniculata]